MIYEGRKRDAAANALLALSFAANAASSAPNLVRSGYDASFGKEIMSRMMAKRRKATASGLDNPHVVSRGSKTFKEFVEEVYLIEGQSREEAEKKRQAKENPDEWRVRKVGRHGEESWTTKRKSSLSGQGKTRTGSAKQQTDPDVNPSEYKAKTSKIADANKEAHHKVSLTRAKELFSGKTPEEQQEIRARHARLGVYFGNDPRNIIGLSRERHTGGEGSVHREIERMDRSIKKAGEEPSKVFSAIKKLRSR